MINRQQPTIMGLQEAQPHQITYLAKQCPEYAWYGLGRDTGEAPPKTETYASEECMAIFFQTSIVEMLDKGTFGCQKRLTYPRRVGMPITTEVVHGRYSDKKQPASGSIFSTRISTTPALWLEKNLSN